MENTIKCNVYGNINSTLDDRIEIIHDLKTDSKKIIAKRSFLRGEKIFVSGIISKIECHDKNFSKILIHWTNILQKDPDVIERMKPFFPRHDILLDKKFTSDVGDAIALHNMYLKENDHIPTTKSLLDLINIADNRLREFVQIYAKLRYNLSYLCTGVYYMMGIGNFVNHSCIPNVMFDFHEKEDDIIIYKAHRDIKAGEELFANYALTIFCDDFEVRRKMTLKNCSFECACEYCLKGLMNKPEDGVLSTMIPDIFAMGLACATCNNNVDNPSVLKKCGGCSKFSYCNTTCQKKHWNLIHKKQCDRKHLTK